MNLPLAIGLGVLAGLAAYALVEALVLLRRITSIVDRIESSPLLRILTKTREHAEDGRG